MIPSSVLFQIEVTTPDAPEDLEITTPGTAFKTPLEMLVKPVTNFQSTTVRGCEFDSTTGRAITRIIHQ